MAEHGVPEEHDAHAQDARQSGPPPSRRKPIADDSDSKTCPACAEERQDAAVVCRYCGHRFDAADTAPTAAPHRRIRIVAGLRSIPLGYVAAVVLLVVVAGAVLIVKGSSSGHPSAASPAAAPIPPAPPTSTVRVTDGPPTATTQNPATATASPGSGGSASQSPQASPSADPTPGAYDAATAISDECGMEAYKRDNSVIPRATAYLVSEAHTRPTVGLESLLFDAISSEQGGLCGGNVDVQHSDDQLLAATDRVQAATRPHNRFLDNPRK